jgi:translation elongation factor EF-1beta
MNTAVDQVMASCELLPALEHLGRDEIRAKVGQYLEKLSSAGHSDTEELAFFGLAYLRILHEGPDPRHTGC